MKIDQKNHTVIISLVVVVLLGGVVWFVLNGKTGKQPTRNQMDEERQRQMPERFEFPGTVPTGSEGITPGAMLTVAGTRNTDGSITAQTLVIGEFPEGVMPTRNPDSTNGEEVTSEPFQGGFTPPEGFQPPEGIDFEELQSLSPEERQARLEELRAEGGFSGPGAFGDGGQRQRAGFRTGSAMVRGNILDVSDSIITVELSGGGSVLVFYGENTELLKFEDTENL